MWTPHLTHIWHSITLKDCLLSWRPPQEQEKAATKGRMEYTLFQYIIFSTTIFTATATQLSGGLLILHIVMYWSSFIPPLTAQRSIYVACTPPTHCGERTLNLLMNPHLQNICTFSKTCETPDEDQDQCRTIQPQNVTEQY